MMQDIVSVDESVHECQYGPLFILLGPIQFYCIDIHAIAIDNSNCLVLLPIQY